MHNKVFIHYIIYYKNAVKLYKLNNKFSVTSFYMQSETKIILKYIPSKRNRYAFCNNN